MTNLNDVIRQAEAALHDTHYPPTNHEREVYTRILQEVYAVTVDMKTCE
jgi:hypothetical protein